VPALIVSHANKVLIEGRRQLKAAEACYSVPRQVNGIELNVSLYQKEVQQTA
jgi:hypothetical protein